MTTPEERAAVEAETPKLAHFHDDGKLNLLANFITHLWLNLVLLAIFALILLLIGAVRDVIFGLPFDLTPGEGWAKTLIFLGVLSFALAALRTVFAALGAWAPGRRSGRE